MHEYVELAKQMGFSGAAVLPVEKLTIVPAYRMFCEENLCGNYGKLPACPPACGAVEEMTEKTRHYQFALILQTELSLDNVDDPAENKLAKRQHNIITEQLLDILAQKGNTDILMMGAGPWGKNSCLSAYSVDAQKMAEEAGLTCWSNDGLVRYFSLLLFNETC